MGGVLPLPVVSLVRKYCDLLYITNLNERERLVDYVTILDDEYLQHVAEQREAEERKGGK